jgi:hypothetical protein
LERGKACPVSQEIILEKETFPGQQEFEFQKNKVPKIIAWEEFDAPSYGKAKPALGEQGGDGELSGLLFWMPDFRQTSNGHHQSQDTHKSSRDYIIDGHDGDLPKP